MSARRWILSLPLLLAAAALAPSFLAAAPESAPESLEALMPDDVVGYVKLTGLGARLEEFLKSDLRKKLESIEAVKLALSQGPWQKFESGLADFREATGKDPLQVFKALLGKEILVGARLGFSGPEFIAVTRTAGTKELEETIRALRQWAEKHLGQALEGEKSTYEGKTLERLDKVIFTSVGEVLAVATSDTGLKSVVDLASGKSTGSLKKAAVFQRRGGAASKDCLASLAVRPQFLPNFSVPEKLDNVLGSLLVGGWAGALGASELLTASLELNGGNLKLDLSSVLSAKGQDESYWKKYQSFFPEALPDGVISRLEERGVLGVVQLRRNLAQWWENREALLVPKAAGGLIEFANTMSIFFGGRNFQDEVLPELGSTITLVARNQEYSNLREKPQPAIPGFAAVFELKSAKEFGDSMVAAFYTVVGIINADMAQKKKEGGMAMIPKPMKVADVDMHAVSLTGPKDVKPGMLHNFTPSLAIVGSRVILSSSAELTKILVEELPRETPKDAAKKTAATGSVKGRDALFIDGQAAHAILAQNRESLVADSMLKKGSGREEADRELDSILEALKYVRGLSLESGLEGNAVHWKLELRTGFGESSGKASAKKEAPERPAPEKESKKPPEESTEKSTEKKGVKLQ